MIPDGDLAHIQYENKGYCASETILLISTPRSGSTMLCTDIDVEDGGPMAEYCQPYQIIPYLMQARPLIKSGEKLNFPRYADYLKNFRSGRSKKLFINIHASHIDIFKQLQPFLPPVTGMFILLRKDIIKQAVSYYIASATGNWSSKYGKTDESLLFDSVAISQKLSAIYEGVKKNFEEFSASSKIIFYEDYVVKKQSFARMNNLKQSQNHRTITQRQATEINASFVRQYREHIEKSGNKEAMNLINNYLRFIGSMNAN